MKTAIVKRISTGKILKGTICNDGYFMGQLLVNGERKGKGFGLLADMYIIIEIIN
jgi:hypothetical protein